MRCIVLAAVLIVASRGTAMDRHSVRGDASSGLRALRRSGPCHTQLQTQPVPTPTQLALEQMDSAERANSRISVEFESFEDDAIALGHEVERLWNDGQFEVALARLRDLEARVGFVAVGNSWRKPVPTLETTLWESDVRIGNRDSLLNVALVLDTASGYLFAVLRHSDDAPHWSICMSANNGISWDETFTWVGSHPTSIDGAAFGDHVYVVYNSPWESARQVRARRFLCSDGSVDTFRDGRVWTIACYLDTGDTMREVSLVSGRADNLLYLYTLTSGGSVWPCCTRADWDFWNQGRVVTSYASSGIDGTANKGSSTTCNFFSYYDLSDTLRVYRHYAGGTQLCFSLFAGNGSPTSISACRDTVICAYEDETSLPHHIRYAIRYGEDDTWVTGTLSNADTAAESPAVIACGGGRFGAVYRHCSPTRELRFRQRTDNAPWSVPFSIADNEPFASRPGIECLGADAYGGVYLSDTGPVVRGAFFDRSDWPYGVAEQPRPQASGRASLATVVRRVLLLPRAASHKHRAASLLDITGRAVLDLKPGANDVRDLAPGVYFVVTSSPVSSPPEGERVRVRGRQPSVASKAVVTR